MSRTEVVSLPVRELLKNQNVLAVEKDPQGNFSKGQKRIKLGQFPTEELHFVLSLTSRVSMSSKTASSQCHFHFKSALECQKCHNPILPNEIAYVKVDLRFENYLHEMSHDYKYQVKCNLVDYKSGEQQQLCCLEDLRTFKCMTFLINTHHRLGCIGDEFNQSFITVDIERVCNKHNTSRSKCQSDFQALLDNPMHSDVTLKVENTSIRAHKCVLSCRSEVFQRMFNSQMSETQTGIVNIADVSAAVMRELLRYMYTGRAENLDTMTVDLFEAAARYQMEDLKKECMEFFIFNVNPENIVDFSALVDLYNVEELPEKISAFMKKYKRVVRKTN